MRIAVHAARSVFLVLVLGMPTMALGQGGSLAPTSAPAPTMLTLDLVEPRIPLVDGPPGVITNTAGGFTLNVSGSYYLTENLTVTGGSAIVINNHGVTIDLNGFTIRSLSPVAGGVMKTSGELEMAPHRPASSP